MVPSWKCVVTGNATLDAQSACLQKFNTSVISADVRDRFDMSRDLWEYTEGRHFSVATQLTDDTHLLAITSGEGQYTRFLERNFLFRSLVLYNRASYLMGPYNGDPNLTLALITPVSNCAGYKKVYISAFNGNIRQKIS